MFWATMEELSRRPFTTAEARVAGLSWDQLQSARFRRLRRGTYVSARVPESPALVLAAVLDGLPPVAALSGRTAAWLHGLDVPPFNPIQVTIPKGCGISGRAGISIRRAPLEDRQVVSRQGMRTTSLLRTILDLGRTLSLVEAVVIADAALHQRRLTLDDLREAVHALRGSHGVSRLRQLVDLADPRAESPMESRLRLLLVLAGLPRPESQVTLKDERGLFLGRADLYYRSHHLVVEYDGGTHRLSLIDDNRRQNRLLGAGYRPLRFTAPDVLGAPDSVIARVRGELAADVPAHPAS